MLDILKKKGGTSPSPPINQSFNTSQLISHEALAAILRQEFLSL